MIGTRRQRRESVALSLGSRRRRRAACKLPNLLPSAVPAATAHPRCPRSGAWGPTPAGRQGWSRGGGSRATADTPAPRAAARQQQRRRTTSLCTTSSANSSSASSARLLVRKSMRYLCASSTICCTRPARGAKGRGRERAERRSVGRRIGGGGGEPPQSSRHHHRLTVCDLLVGLDVVRVPPESLHAQGTEPPAPAGLRATAGCHGPARNGCHRSQKRRALLQQATHSARLASDAPCARHRSLCACSEGWLVIQEVSEGEIRALRFGSHIFFARRIAAARAAADALQGAARRPRDYAHPSHAAGAFPADTFSATHVQCWDGTLQETGWRGRAGEGRPRRGRDCI